MVTTLQEIDQPKWKLHTQFLQVKIAGELGKSVFFEAQSPEEVSIFLLVERQMGKRSKTKKPNFA